MRVMLSDKEIQLRIRKKEGNNLQLLKLGVNFAAVSSGDVAQATVAAGEATLAPT